MEPDSRFQGKSREFWAATKLLSETVGYSSKKRTGPPLRRYAKQDINRADLGFSENDPLAKEILTYLNYRADLLENTVEKLLMDRAGAKALYDRLVAEHSPKCNLPMNKQKGVKQHPMYLTCAVNILTEASLRGRPFNDSPRQLCTIRDAKGRLRLTLSRWMDGAYSNTANPHAVWEVKEYYGTKTFGSRVADGVYESQLDGYELDAASQILERPVRHYLVVDDHFTWWVKGKSYLCRLVDLMHVGLVDEVVFGREVEARWPKIVAQWPE